MFFFPFPERFSSLSYACIFQACRADSSLFPAGKKKILKIAPLSLIFSIFSGKLHLFVFLRILLHLQLFIFCHPVHTKDKQWQFL